MSLELAGPKEAFTEEKEVQNVKTSPPGRPRNTILCHARDYCRVRCFSLGIMI